MPRESTLYIADQAHVPYGPKRREVIMDYCEALTTYLFEQDCKAVVVACNTASAAALKHLRQTFPQQLIIGMEPAVKPAAAITRTGVIGIMATEATFQGRLYQATAGRHAQHCTLINQVCHGLAEQIEAGDIGGQATEALLRGFIQPMLDAGADTIVLACTHYPFVLPVVRKIAGRGVNVIDPAPAIARHLQHQLRLADKLGQAADATTHRLLTTAAGDAFESAVQGLVPINDVEFATLSWGEQLRRSGD